MSLVKAGQITVTTAGTAVQGTDTGPGIYEIRPMHTNTGTYCYLGNDGAGDVTSANGYQLKAGEVSVFQGNLNLLWFDSDTNGDKLCWLEIATQ